MEEKVIKNILDKLQIPKHFLGYKYIKTLIINILNKDIYTVIKEEYAVAKSHKTTRSKVERAIRYAVESSIANKYFKVKYKITVKGFVELVKDEVLEKLSMEQEILSKNNVL